MKSQSLKVNKVIIIITLVESDIIQREQQYLRRQSQGDRRYSTILPDTWQFGKEWNKVAARIIQFHFAVRNVYEFFSLYREKKKVFNMTWRCIVGRNRSHYELPSRWCTKTSNSLVLSQIDYSNRFLYGLPKSESTKHRSKICYRDL